MASYLHVQTDVQRSHLLRLVPGQDLKSFLSQWAKENDISAGFICSAVGSLNQAHLRLANAKTSSKKQGPFEIVSLSGSISRAGLHIHIGLADQDGLFFGGHLLEGCPIFTTCEVLIFEFPIVQMARLPDPTTGYLELSFSSTKIAK